MVELWTLLQVAVYSLHLIPGWTWVTAGITLVHTFEEAAGEIWHELGVPAVAYYAFQAFVWLLGWYVLLNGQLVWLFVGIRVLDVVVTHGILGKPGMRTAPLLLLDAAVVYTLFEW